VPLGCEQLGISDDGCKAVLEEDGTEIDDKSLQDIGDKVVMILSRDEDRPCKCRYVKCT